MHSPQKDERILRTSAGDFPLDECRLSLAGREWKILHVAAALSREQESHFLNELRERLPYGITLWAAAVALANEVAVRADVFRGSRVLELGAGTGLPGIIAASHGAEVLQTDRNELVMSVCRRNAALNQIHSIEQRLMDWTDWGETERYDWILGSDILYAEEVHAGLRRIFESNLQPGGRILVSDPFRAASLKLLEELETEGWSISLSKWSIGEEADLRPIGVFELSPPA
jgi:predicted nicotinamide N-methyase